jgi:hypothetical protein
MTQTPAEYVDGSADVTSLTDLGAHLITQAYDHAARRAARTVWDCPALTDIRDLLGRSSPARPTSRENTAIKRRQR